MKKIEFNAIEGVASSAQGDKADTALQPGEAATVSQGSNADIAKIRVQDTRASAIATSFTNDIAYVQTQGYTTIGDNGKALYKRVGSQPAHNGKFQSADGAWWELAELKVNAPMLNITPDGVSDMAALLLASGSVPGSYFELAAGTYYIGQNLVVPATWRFASGTKFLIADGVTVDFSNNQPEIHAPKKQRFYFAGSKTGSVIGLDEVHVGWFAGDKLQTDVDATADIQKAANAVASGGTLLWPRLYLASNGTSYITMANNQNIRGQHRSTSRIKFLTASTMGFNWTGSGSSLVSDFGAYTINDLQEPTAGAVFLYSAGRAHNATRFWVSSCYDAVITQVPDCSFTDFRINDCKHGGIRIEAKNETHIHNGIIAANSAWVSLASVTGTFTSGEAYTAANGASGTIWRNPDGTAKLTYTTKSPQGQTITGGTSGATATVNAISLGHSSAAIALVNRCDATIISDIEISGGVCSLLMSAPDVGTGSLAVKISNCLLDSNMGNCAILNYQSDTVFSNCWFSSFIGTNNDIYAVGCRGLRFNDCAWISSNATAASFNACSDVKINESIIADTNVSNTASIPALWFVNCLRSSVRGVTIGSSYGYATGNVKGGITNDNSNLIITDSDLSQCVTPIFTTNGGINKINNVKGYAVTNRGSPGVTFASGLASINHGLTGTPTYVNVHVQGDTTNYLLVASITSTVINLVGRDRISNSAISDGTITVVWEASTAEFIN